MTSVTLDSLTHCYGNTTAVDALSLHIPAGELVALLGPSGCGKSTTLRMIAGLLPPSSGDIRFGEQSVLTIPAERRGAVMMFQNHRLFPHMNVADNVGFGLRMRGERREIIRQEVNRYLALVGLAGLEDRYPAQISGGQAQRVALARALIVHPNVLLLDEPLSNLDANLRNEMRLLIRHVQQEVGITTLFVTHDQTEAAVVSDRIALLLGGVLQQYAVPQAFYRRPANVATARFFSGDNFLPGLRQGNCVVTEAGTFHLPPDLEGPGGEVLLTIRPEAIEVAESAQNQLCVCVVETIFQGTNTELIVEFGTRRWRVITAPDSPYQAGDHLTLYLPSSRLWVLPAAD